MIRRLLLFIMWFVALPFLSLQAQSPGGVVRTDEGDSTYAYCMHPVGRYLLQTSILMQII